MLITPLVTTPYLSRVLGAEGIGTISYAESIMSYFTMAATLGLTTFGRREISYVRDNGRERTKIFWEAKLFEVMTTAVVLAIYIPFALTQENQLLYLILSFNLIAVIADATWFFQGLEEFGKVILRNIIFKAINIAYIFIFVKSREDVIRYVFGLAFFLLLSNVSLWIYLPQYTEKIDIRELRPFRHIKAVFLLFIPTIAIQVYTVLDKTMIGLITQSAFENGYYEQALKISRMVLTMVTALGTVVSPRIGYHFGRGETQKVNAYIYRGYRFVWFLGIPLCFGLLGISSNLVPWFFGAGYDKVIPLLGILGFLIPAIGINNVTGMQYLIPTKRQNIFTLTVLIGAGVNFLLNLVQIYFFQSVVAAIASLAAETTIALVQLYFVRKEFSIRQIFLSSRHYLGAGGVMYIVLKISGLKLSSSVIHTVGMIFCGALVYIVSLLLLRDSFLIENVGNILGKIKRRR